MYAEGKKPVDGIQHPLIAWQRKRGMGVSRSFVQAVWGLHLALGSDTSLLLALIECQGPGRGMCGQKRIAPVSKTVMSTEQLGVLE